MNNQFEVVDPIERIDSKFLSIFPSKNEYKTYQYRGYVYSNAGFVDVGVTKVINTSLDPEPILKELREKFFNLCTRVYFLGAVDELEWTRYIDAEFIIDRKHIDLMVTYLLLQNKL